MEDQAKYEVTMLIASPTVPLTQDQFFQQATASCWAFGPHLLASSGINHTPAYWCEHSADFDLRGGFAMPARTEYYVQVRDMEARSDAEPFGAWRFTARGATPEACLADLAAQLRELEERAYEADPARRGEQQCDMYQELAACDFAA